LHHQRIEKMANSTAEYDQQLKLLDEMIRREKEFVEKNRNKYASGFIAKKDRDIKTLESVRETVRQARQNQQMTGMSGQRIDE
jgi:hypothetical protein